MVKAKGTMLKFQRVYGNIDYEIKKLIIII